MDDVDMKYDNQIAQEIAKSPQGSKTNTAVHTLLFLRGAQPVAPVKSSEKKRKSRPAGSSTASSRAAKRICLERTRPPKAEFDFSFQCDEKHPIAVSGSPDGFRLGSDEDKSDSFIENLLTLSEPLWLFDVLRNADGKIIASPITDARTGEYSALSYRIADRPLHSSKPVLDAMITSDNTIPECFLSLLPLLYGQQTQLLARLDLAGGDAEPYLIQPGMLNWIRNVFLFFTRKTVPPVSRAVCSMITAATPYFQVLLLPHHREMVIGLLTDREFEAADAVLNKVKTIRAQDVDGLAPFIQQAGQQASDAIWGTRAFYTANTPSGYVEPFCVGTVHPKTVCLYLAAPPKDWAELQRLQKFVFDSR